MFKQPFHVQLIVPFYVRLINLPIPTILWSYVDILENDGKKHPLNYALERV